MKLTLVFILLIISFAVNAGEEEHFRLALEFDRLSGAMDKSKLVDSLLPAFAPQLKTEEEERLLHKYLVEVMTSDAYYKGKARAYMSIYSEPELKELIALVKLPAYKLLQQRRYEINTELVKSMQSLINSTAPELLARVKAEVGR